jgi:hypothetical protein
MSDAEAQGGEEAPTEALRLEVVAEEARRGDEERVMRATLGHPMLRHHFPSGDLWLVGFDIEDKDPDESEPRFSAIVHDTVTGGSALADGYLDDPESIDVNPTANQLPPGEEEFVWAVSVLAQDLEFGPLLGDDGTTTYRPVPPLANVVLADGNVERVVTVGLRTEGPPPSHRIVGVRTGDGEIFREPQGAAPPSSRDCGPPPASGCPPLAGERLVRVRVLRGDTALWDLVVVRPHASSGMNGSGVELRLVDYRGQRVFNRAHVPILNVRYDDDGPQPGCGPTYRDWQNAEACFDAEGDEPVPGFRVGTTRPRTILESGDDGGSFRGVALWLDGDELLVVSQLQAGWYRYVSEWRLHADGTVRPRFGFAGVRNPCTCAPHDHHVYWRFDFDILDSDGNLVQEYNDTPVLGTGSWHTVRHEVFRRRSAANGRYWRVRNVRSSQGYAIRPGAEDGTTDDYGAGDVWILRYHPDEVDDGEGITNDPVRSRAQLDRFVSGESVERQDVVVWYAAHLPHDDEHDSDATPQSPGGHRVGPDLVPHQWKDRPAVTTPFASLRPPTEDELRPPARPAP